MDALGYTHSDAGESGAASDPLPDRARWEQTVDQRIRHSQYRLQALDEGFEAVNHRHRLQVQFLPDRITFRQHEAAGQSVGEVDFELRFEKWGRPENLRDVGAGEVDKGDCLDETLVDATGECLESVDIRHQGITEWWHNRPDGLEQGWRIEQRPAGEGPLRLEVAVDGAKVELDEDRQGAVLRGQDGTWHYDKLEVWDANRQALPASMVEADDGLAIEVDDREAVYPLTIDPLLTTAG